MLIPTYIPMWPEHQRKETWYAFNFNDRRTARILNINGEHFEENVFPVIWRAEQIVSQKFIRGKSANTRDSPKYCTAFSSKRKIARRQVFRLLDRRSEMKKEYPALDEVTESSVKRRGSYPEWSPRRDYWLWLDTLALTHSEGDPEN